MRPGAWEEVSAWGDTFTCYSSAIAAWALRDPKWAEMLDGGLHLVITEEGDGLFGFSHFPTGLAARLGLVRRGADDSDAACAAIGEELDHDGRVIVSGDGFRLPWHVAYGRHHVPHWFTLVPGPDGPIVVDPFDCRTEMGRQSPVRRTLVAGELRALLDGLPGDDPVLSLREGFALGEDDRPLPRHPITWLGAGARAAAPRQPSGPVGPAAVRRLAEHFKANGASLDAYSQADDLWSVARHRAFFARRAEFAVSAVDATRSDGAVSGWVKEFVIPVAARWGHVAPLLMQARLSAAAARRPSSSVADTLFQLADLEAAAIASRPAATDPPTHG